MTATLNEKDILDNIDLEGEHIACRGCFPGRSVPGRKLVAMCGKEFIDDGKDADWLEVEVALCLKCVEIATMRICPRCGLAG